MADDLNIKSTAQFAAEDEKMQIPFAPNVLQTLPAIFDALHYLMGLPTPEKHEPIPANMAELNEVFQHMAEQSLAGSGTSFVDSLSLDGGWSHEKKSGATCDILYVSGVMIHANVGTNFQFTSHPEGKGVRFCYDEEANAAYFCVGYLPQVECSGAMVSEEWFQIAKDNQDYGIMFGAFLEAVDLFLCEEHENNIAYLVQDWGDRLQVINQRREENPLFGLPDGAELQHGNGDTSELAIAAALAILENVGEGLSTEH